MTHQDVCTLLDFHYWARDRMFEALRGLSPEQYVRELGGSFKSVRDTVVHTYAAEWIWYMRWQGASPSALVTSDQFPDLASLQKAWVELETKVREFLAGLDDAGVERVLPYTLLSGVASSSPICSCRSSTAWAFSRPHAEPTRPVRSSSSRDTRRSTRRSRPSGWVSTTTSRSRSRSGRST